MTRIVVDRDGSLGLAKSLVVAMQSSGVGVSPRTVTRHLLVSEWARVLRGQQPHELGAVRDAFWTLCPPSDR